jgi:proton-translocating NADH-quinone oxidoreductase chain N
VLPLLLLIPLIGLLVVSIAVRSSLRQVAWGFAFLVCLVQIALVIFAPAWLVQSNDVLQKYLGFHLAMTDLSRVVLLSVGIVLAAALLIGQAMMEPSRLHSFASLILVSLIGMNGMALVTDLFTLYVFLEITSVGSFVLIAFNRDKPALEGAFKYVVLSAVATVFMLGSIALLVMVAGGTSFAAVKGVLDPAVNETPHWIAKIAVAGFVCGLLIKGGLVPFHGWVLGAYSAAPAPVSVLLGGIVTKVSGIYGLICLSVYVFPHSEQLNQAFLAVGALSAIVGAFAAIGQTDMKRMLAYSSISQVGYIVLGLGAVPVNGNATLQAGSAVVLSLGVVGAIFHLFNHAIFKSLLFVTSSSLEKQLGTTDMYKMGGLDSRMRITSATSLLGMLSIAGIPPLSGFWSKLLIIVALWQTDHRVYAMIAVAVSVVTLGYMLVLQKRIFFGKVADDLANVREAGPMFLLPAVSLAAITVGVGVFCPLLFNSFLLPIQTLFGGAR